jgi:hypothetical protein
MRPIWKSPTSLYAWRWTSCAKCCARVLHTASYPARWAGSIPAQHKTLSDAEPAACFFSGHNRDGAIPGFHLANNDGMLHASGV